MPNQVTRQAHLKITLVFVLDLQTSHSCFDQFVSSWRGKEKRFYMNIRLQMVKEKEGKKLLLSWFSLLFSQPEIRGQEKIDAFADKVMRKERPPHPIPIQQDLCMTLPLVQC